MKGVGCFQRFTVRMACVIRPTGVCAERLNEEGSWLCLAGKMRMMCLVTMAL